MCRSGSPNAAWLSESISASILCCGASPLNFSRTGGHRDATIFSEIQKVLRNLKDVPFIAEAISKPLDGRVVVKSEPHVFLTDALVSLVDVIGYHALNHITLCLDLGLRV